MRIYENQWKWSTESFALNISINLPISSYLFYFIFCSINILITNNSLLFFHSFTFFPISPIKRRIDSLFFFFLFSTHCDHYTDTYISTHRYRHTKHIRLYAHTLFHYCSTMACCYIKY